VRQGVYCAGPRIGGDRAQSLEEALPLAQGGWEARVIIGDGAHF
jgi:hypothetical protein